MPPARILEPGWVPHCRGRSQAMARATCGWNRRLRPYFHWCEFLVKNSRKSGWQASRKVARLAREARPGAMRDSLIAAKVAWERANAKDYCGRLWPEAEAMATRYGNRFPGSTCRAGHK